MNTLVKSLVVGIAAAMFAAAPALASAERIYYLVGMRHVYRIGPDMYLNVDAREKIEKDYADQVAADNDEFNKAVASGANAAKESADLKSALHDLAVERDQELAALYTPADEERDLHPEFKIQGDGPYQVIGINVHVRQNVEVIDDYVVYAPWPGYVCTDQPYGWSYGVVYQPNIFIGLYTGWCGLYIGWGCPAYVGFCGGFGPIIIGGCFRGDHGLRWGGGGFGHGVYGGYGRGGIGRVAGRFNSGFARGKTSGRYNAGFARGLNAGRNSLGRSNAGSFGSSRYSAGTSGGSRYSNSFRNSSSNRGTSTYGRGNIGTGTSGSRYSSSFRGSAGSPSNSRYRTSTPSNGSTGSRYSHSFSSYSGRSSSSLGGRSSYSRPINGGGSGYSRPSNGGGSFGASRGGAIGGGSGYSRPSNGGGSSYSRPSNGGGSFGASRGGATGGGGRSSGGSNGHRGH